MKTFMWLLFSGGLWFLLIQLAPKFDVPPQLISMSRNVYLGTFSIFMMVELRQKNDLEKVTVATLSMTNMVWYLVPLLSVILLWLFSPKLQMTPRLWIIMGGLYLLQLNFLALRSMRSGMRSGVWDLLVPIMLLPLLLNDTVAMGSVVLGTTLLLWLMRRPVTNEGQHVSDALITQLPSLCIAPVLLIILRDVLGTSSELERADMEVLGMVINGIGSALWMAIVMRTSRLGGVSIYLWCAGIATALTLYLVFDTASITYVVGAMLVAELIRGSLWLGITQLLSNYSRWQGFIVNAMATALPLTALLASHFYFAAEQFIIVYSAIHVFVPLFLWRSCGTYGHKKNNL